MISDEEYLERIVAGIHSITNKDADVVWNERINGRQFDVVMRFKVGTLNYLVLVEVKNRTRKASAEDLDAFVTKTRDQNSNKAVFVSAAGFQTGAITVAKKHGVELFTVTFEEDDLAISGTAARLTLTSGVAAEGVAPIFSIGTLTPVNNVENITVCYEDGRKVALPTEATQMEYYCRQTVFEDGRSLVDIISPMLRSEHAVGVTAKLALPLCPVRMIEPPDEHAFPRGRVASLDLTVTVIESRPLTGNTMFEPSMLVGKIVYKNVVTNEGYEFQFGQLPIGEKRVSVGRFYFLYHPLRYYYCDAIKGDSVRWILVESFQCGQLVSCTMMQQIKYSKFYIPVSDIKIAERLQRRLNAYRKLVAAN